jgi:hypothetical protein
MNDIFIVPLTNSAAICLIDSEDAPRIMLKNWQHNKTDGCAQHSVWKNGRNSSVKMHREILNTKKNFVTHHKNKIRLDNRKSNLLNTTSSINNHVCRKKGKTSAYRGVTKLKSGLWRAQVKKNYVNYFLGDFNTEIDAVLAYNKGAIKHYGVNADINII